MPEETLIPKSPARPRVSPVVAGVGRLLTPIVSAGAETAIERCDELATLLNRAKDAPGVDPDLREEIERCLAEGEGIDVPNSEAWEVLMMQMCVELGNQLKASQEVAGNLAAELPQGRLGKHDDLTQTARERLDVAEATLEEAAPLRALTAHETDAGADKLVTIAKSLRETLELSAVAVRELHGRHCAPPDEDPRRTKERDQAAMEYYFQVERATQHILKETDQELRQRGVLVNDTPAQEAGSVLEPLRREDLVRREPAITPPSV